MLKEVVDHVGRQQEIRAIGQNERVIRAPAGVILQLKDPEPDPGESGPCKCHNIIPEELRHIAFNLHEVKLWQKPNGLRDDRESYHHLREFEVLVFLEIGDDGKNERDDEDDSPVPVVGLFHEAHFAVFEHESHEVDGESKGDDEFDPAPEVVSEDGEPEEEDLAESGDGEDQLRVERDALHVFLFADVPDEDGDAHDVEHVAQFEEEDGPVHGYSL